MIIGVYFFRLVINRRCAASVFFFYFVSLFSSVVSFFRLGLGVCFSMVQVSGRMFCSGTPLFDFIFPPPRALFKSSFF